jgi:hypothetical protein
MAESDQVSEQIDVAISFLARDHEIAGQLFNSLTGLKVFFFPRSQEEIVSLSNFMTIGVMRALADSGLRSPDDVSFVAVDDFDWADIMRPRPTLIAQPIEDMTRTAIAALLEQIASDRRPARRRLLFAPKLIVRDSCGPFEGEDAAPEVERRLAHEKG